MTHLPTAQLATLRVPRIAWALLVVQPPLSLAYLWSVREHWLPPTFWAPLAFAALPVIAAGFAIVALRGGARSGKPRVQPALALLLATVELGWCVLVAGMVGFAIALQSG
ncbi:MAG: hypothetical protein N3C12_12675 [Candidatus Binatia bacterium]|nr:hypothetical protein [Candidatus Binatia bacterium]